MVQLPGGHSLAHTGPALRATESAGALCIDSSVSQLNTLHQGASVSHSEFHSLSAVNILGRIILYRRELCCALYDVQW